MHALAKEVTITEALSNDKTANFTRIPVYDHAIDNICGLVLKAYLYENERQGQG